MAKTNSRPKRWAEAVEKLRTAFDSLTSAATEYDSALEELRDVKQEYEEWKDNLPENLQGGTLAEKLETICDMDMDNSADDAIGELENLITEAEGAELPMGFGRD